MFTGAEASQVTDNIKSQVTVVKLHNHQNCVDVLRQDQEQGALQYKGELIGIVPDYAASVAKAQAVFNDVRNPLLGWRGICFGIHFPAQLCMS